MRLGFGQVLALMSSMHPGVGARVVQARLKYFQRMSFPAGMERVGSGGRVDYEGDDLVQVLFAFEFLAAGVAPLLATTMIGSVRTELLTSFAMAWIGRDAGADPLLLAHPDGLEAKRGGGGGMLVGSRGDLDSWARDGNQAERRVVVLNAGSVARQLDRVLGAMAEGGRAAAARALAEMDDWADRRSVAGGKSAR